MTAFRATTTSFALAAVLCGTAFTASYAQEDVETPQITTTLPAPVTDSDHITPKPAPTTPAVPAEPNPEPTPAPAPTKAPEPVKTPAPAPSTTPEPQAPAPQAPKPPAQNNTPPKKDISTGNGGATSRPPVQTLPQRTDIDATDSTVDEPSTETVNPSAETMPVVPGGGENYGIELDSGQSVQVDDGVANVVDEDGNVVKSYFIPGATPSSSPSVKPGTVTVMPADEHPKVKNFRYAFSFLLGAIIPTIFLVREKTKKQPVALETTSGK